MSGYAQEGKAMTKNKKKEEEIKKAFEFPISFNFYTILILVLAASVTVLQIFFKNSNVYKFFLLTLFNLLAVGIFIAVLWLIVVGIPQILSVIEQAMKTPGKVKDYVFGEN